MFQLRFPFRPLHKTTEFESILALDSPNRHATLEPHLPYIVLNLCDFPTEDAAKEHLPLAWGTVMVASVLAGQGFRAETSLDCVKAYDFRSTLIHDGYLPNAKLSEAFKLARQSVRALLLANLGIPPSILNS